MMDQHEAQALGHELAIARPREHNGVPTSAEPRRCELPFRTLIGDPFDPARWTIILAVTTLTIRLRRYPAEPYNPCGGIGSKGTMFVDGLPLVARLMLVLAVLLLLWLVPLSIRGVAAHRRRGGSEISRLVEALADRDSYPRRRDTLDKIVAHGSDAVPYLVGYVQDFLARSTHGQPDYRTRGVVQSLGEIADPRAVDVLLELLERDNADGAKALMHFPPTVTRVARVLDVLKSEADLGHETETYDHYRKRFLVDLLRQWSVTVEQVEAHIEPGLDGRCCRLLLVLLNAVAEDTAVPARPYLRLASIDEYIVVFEVIVGLDKFFQWHDESAPDWLAAREVVEQLASGRRHLVHSYLQRPYEDRIEPNYWATWRALLALARAGTVGQDVAASLVKGIIKKRKISVDREFGVCVSVCALCRPQLQAELRDLLVEFVFASRDRFLLRSFEFYSYCADKMRYDQPFCNMDSTTQTTALKMLDEIMKSVRRAIG